MTHTPGPWVNTFFCKPNGEPIQTVQDVSETMAGSAGHSERAELFGVSLCDADSDGCSTVVCYTGNGPNAHNNARLIAAAPELLAALKAIADDYALLCGDGMTEATQPPQLRDATAAIAKAEGK